MAPLANPPSLQVRKFHTPLLHKHLSSERNSTIRTPISILQRVPFTKTISLTSSTRRSLGSSIPVGQSGGENGQENGQENHAVETVLKLYAALKNNNIRELLDILYDECRCVCNFFSFFHPFNGKQGVLKIFNNLITFLGNNFEFYVQTTLHEGLQVGVSWRLEWKKSHVPLGKGFSLYIRQVYHGKVFIRNMGMLMEPLLRIIGLATAIIDKTSYWRLSKDGVKKVMLTLISAAIILIFIKPAMY